MFDKHSRFSYFLCLALPLLFSIALFSDCRAKSPASFDWDKLLKAWEVYLNYPSSQNADKVTALLPDSGHVQYTGTEEERNAIDSISKNLGMLEYQIYSSDRSAVRLAFHLIPISDGAFAEELDIILGWLIRINARLFLEELQNNRPLVVDFGLPVGNFGYQYVDRFEARRLETNLRIKALEKVRDQSLEGIRDECIRALKEE